MPRRSNSAVRVMAPGGHVLLLQEGEYSHTVTSAGEQAQEPEEAGSIRGRNSAGRDPLRRATLSCTSA